MRRIAAPYIFPVTRPPIKNGLIEINEHGLITGIYNQPETPGLMHDAEFCDGILVPGFINTHCHLELSHLKGQIMPGSGLGGFIGQINKLRYNQPFNTEEAIKTADEELFRNGTVATGDISNNILSLDVKLTSLVVYHTFIEVFGFLPSRAERAFQIAEGVFAEFTRNGLPASIVPHSPYSVSEPLFRKIAGHALQNQTLLSIHNQESRGENQFFQDGTGPIANHLSNNIGLDLSGWNPPGKNSLESILGYFPSANQLILVHNTFTSTPDIAFIKANRRMSNTYFCLCPNSNLFIENQLPDLNLFRNENLNICLGTDSLASNPRLSILSEMVTLQTRFENIPLEEIVEWACFNGARALNLQDRFGTLEPGKKPGVNLITPIDLKNLRLLPESKVIRIA